MKAKNLSLSLSVLYFVLSLGILSLFFFKNFRGIQGDGIYYYSYTASILWDGDLDLKNQYDHQALIPTKGTITNGNYFIDPNTGKAFSLFNPGTGILMVPAVSLARLINRMSGSSHFDPFDLYYQFYAGYTSVILTSLALLLLFLILKRYFSLGIALISPMLFLFGTNWLFYASVFAAWSHAFAVFLCVFLIWTFLKFVQKKSILSASLFGMCGGIFFSARNFSVLLFAFFVLYSLFLIIKNKDKIVDKKYFFIYGVVFLFFLIGALPQFADNFVQHGNFLITSSRAIRTAKLPFGLFWPPNFKVINFSNLYMLYSNLFNSDNGLFYFHPFYLLGLLGIILIRHRHSRLQGIFNLMLLGLFIFWFIDASYFDSWFNRAAGSGFGHRRFLIFIPFFVFGAANVLSYSKNSKIIKYLTFFVYSSLFTCGASLFHLFTSNFRSFFITKDSLLGLYAHLLGSKAALGLNLISFIAIILISKAGKERYVFTWRKPLIIFLILGCFIFPVIFLKPNSPWLRERFRTKKGFFLMYSTTSYVHLSGKYWGFPENMGRPLLSSRGIIKLPAPLEKGDILLFKLTALYSEEVRRVSMNVFLGQESVGRAAIERGTHIYSFPLTHEVKENRKLSIEFKGPRNKTPSIIFHEGRIVFKEEHEPPFGYVDLPPDNYVLDSDKVIIEGWALDDRGVKKVLIKRESLPGDKVQRIDKDGLITLGQGIFQEGKRPDVEKIYILYPDILKSGWIFWLSRSMLPHCNNDVYKIHVFAYDSDGNTTELGKRTIVCEEME